ncbi:MAG TPA: L,D-transpeptidase family protein, partial [Hyphomicrobiaceae bacterium]|nr:L,D-transpeptidase family protein [Hyphomicrobiaceae bacterium]
MRLLAFSAQLRGLLAVPFLAAALAFPAMAEPNPDSSPPQAESTPDTAPAGPNDAAGEGTSPPADSNAAAGEGTSPPADPNAPSGDSQSANPDADAAPEPPKSTVLINIDKSVQEMTVFVDGVELYTWPVSTGIRGYSTPSGTYTTTSMNEIWYSKQWDNAPMPHAVFFTK